MVPIALTIAGSDSSGGAGIQADLKTFSALRVYGASVLTAVTAQNTTGVQAVHVLPGDVVAAQLRSVFADLAVAAVKIGMLGTGEAVRAVTEGLTDYQGPVVLDPVMVATSGDALMVADAEEALKGELLPRATLLTPNLHEAARLLDTELAEDEDAIAAQARHLVALGARAVLVKGGHGTGEEAVDLLCDGLHVERFAAPRIATAHTHGTGCVLSSAIAAHLAHGRSLHDAVARAKVFLTDALRHADWLSVGQGAGPAHALGALWKTLDD